MNATAALPIGIIDVALAFPDVLGKVKEELIHCVISGEDPESMLPEQLRLWCEKHSITGKVRYRYEGTVDFGRNETEYVGTGSWYSSGDDLREPFLEFYAGQPEEPDEEDIPF